MRIEPPKTVLDFKRIEKSILEMMANPYCDIQMFESLEDKLKKCRAKIMVESQKLNENFCVGDVLVSDRFKDAENFPRIFRTHKVDNDFGVVYYKYKGKEDTIGTAYVRKAKFWERMFAWMMN